MAQHFLLSPVARALPDADMQYVCMNDGLAYAYFMLARWGSLAKQVCPRCGAVDAHRPRPDHKQWRCNACRHDFSLKSGSIFQGTRLPYGVLLKAMWMWSTTSKGMSALAMTKVLGIGYEAAYLLLHKFRWAMFTRSMNFHFKGEVEVDVVWLFKHVRKFNNHSKGMRARILTRKQRRSAAGRMRKTPGLTYKEARRMANAQYPGLSKRKNPKEIALLAIAERGPDGRIGRSVGVLVSAETYLKVAPVVERFVAPGSHLFTDGAGAYKKLSYTHTAVDHEECYSEGDGKHSNGVESAFARWRRMEKGVYHRMNRRTAEWYFAECAWREEQRRAHPAQRFTEFLQCVLSMGSIWPLKKYGYEQVQREFMPRHIRLEPVALPGVADLDRLTQTKLLHPPWLAEVASLRDDLLPRPTFALKAPAPRIASWDRRRTRSYPASSFAASWRSLLPQLAAAPYKVAFA